MAEFFAKMGIASWKTTMSGVVMVLSGVVTILQAFLNGTPIPWEVAFGQIVAGVGLLMAKDSNVTGGSSPQTPEADVRVAKDEAKTAKLTAVK